MVHLLVKKFSNFKKFYNRTFLSINSTKNLFLSIKTKMKFIILAAASLLIVNATNAHNNCDACDQTVEPNNYVDG